MTEDKKQGTEHVAIAKALGLSISTKHSIEICKSLRYKTTSYAKTFLGEVLEMKRAVPFKSYYHQVGHKRGMMGGRYPVKACGEFLKLVKSVESNAQVKGLDTANLKITTIFANKASIPSTGGRQRYATKRSNLQIEVKEASKKSDKKSDAKVTKKSESKEVKKEPKVAVEKKVEAAKEEIKEEVKQELKETGMKEEVAEKVAEEVKEETAKVVKEVVKEEVKQEAQPEEVKEIPTPKEDVKEEKADDKVTDLIEETKKKFEGEDPQSKESDSKPVLEVKGEVKEVVKEEPKQEAVEETILEPTPEDLLKQVQEKAAKLNTQEKTEANVGDVENLFDELKKKGTLREQND